MSWSSCVCNWFTSDAHSKCVLEEIFECSCPALSTKLLDAEFNRVQVKVKQIIKKADCIAIISDGWLNVSGQGIIHYIISTPQLVFYKSTDTRTTDTLASILQMRWRPSSMTLDHRRYLHWWQTMLWTWRLLGLKKWRSPTLTSHPLAVLLMKLTPLADSAPEGHHGTENNGYTLQESQGNG